MNRILRACEGAFFITLFLSGFGGTAALPAETNSLNDQAIPERSSYAGLDAAIRALPRPRNLADLARSIKPLASSDWERARAAYIWTTSNIAYDVDAFFSGIYPSTEASAAFSSRKSVCDGYSNIMVSLLGSLGLETRKISGWAKGYGYGQGQGFDRTNHAWVMVRLSGSWRLLDPTWGSGYVNGRSFVRRYAEYWFDTDPRTFVLTHLPEEESLQLLDDPLTMKEFLALPYVPAYECERFWEGGFPPADFAWAVRSGKRLPEGYAFNALAKLGFPGQALAAAVLKGKQLANAYDVEGLDATILEGPAIAQLSTKAETRIALRSSKAISCAIISGGEWIFMAKEGMDFSASFIPAAGRQSLVVEWSGGTEGSYYSLMEWSAR